MYKRVFLIVLDSVGIGELPDAVKFGDRGTNTVRSCFETGRLHIPNMLKMGFGNIEGLEFLPYESKPTAMHGRIRERSMGKDTTIGHWEIAGIVSEKPLPTYPDGFPQEILDEFSRQTGRGVLCNMPYSGTAVIADYGDEHVKSGDLIVYTSADSVFQIAAHEDIVPIETLYEYCRIARKILVGEHAVGRVIARPFVGTSGNYTRTANRHDFSLEPYGVTMLDAVKAQGKDVIAVGKITDIFAGRGVTETIFTHGNTEGMQVTSEIAKKDFNGLCFTNLVDFDMLYGHRNNAEAYANALNVFDAWLGEFIKNLREDDVLMITADHGCDPGDVSTDHTREHIPILVYGNGILTVKLNTLTTFSDIAASVCDCLDVDFDCPGESFMNPLSKMAVEAMGKAYAPYSGYKVGAALLCADGTIYTGCNIENAGYSATNCAERTAFFKAVSGGHYDFTDIAVCGGKDGKLENEPFPPCGICRQVMREFCDSDFRIHVVSADKVSTFTLEELLPMSFGPDRIA